MPSRGWKPAEGKSRLKNTFSVSDLFLLDSVLLPDKLVNWQKYYYIITFFFFLKGF